MTGILGNYENCESNPEKLGLSIFGRLEASKAYYGFHELIVWRQDATGDLFYASDEGCSCPAPFEDYRSVEDLEPLTDYKKFSDDVHEWMNDSTVTDGDRVEAVQLLAKVALYRNNAHQRRGPA